MLLKKLEIFGFKSFAEKTSLEFEPGITAIVGPNGCGKSNIVDSMKWVLGEQSAKELRGGVMEDVIFNGTELADQVNFAEVALTISNESGRLPIDFNEVTISRRLFRSGESEYLINKAPVRLKDIQEMIAGTGIGTKAYSLVEQGKMDLIVSSRPEERRYVFEEASGITRFKNKKKEAIRKLEHTDSNILRVSDIISEVRREISSLERQARKAERYKAVYEELKDKELRYAGFEIQKYKDLISSSRFKKDKIQNNSDSVKQLLEEKESVAKQLRSLIAETSETIAAKENDLREFKSGYQRNSERIEWDRQAITESEEKIKLLDRDLAEIQNRINNSRVKLEDSEKDQSYFQEEEERLIARIKQKKEDVLETDAKQKKFRDIIDDFKSKILELNFELTQKRNILLELEAELKSLKIRLERLHLERQDVIGQIDAQDKQIARCFESLGVKEKELNQANEIVEKLMQDKASLLSRKQGIEFEKVELDKKIAAFKARLISWREIASSELGSSESLKIIQQDMSQSAALLSKILQVAVEDISKVELAYRSYLESLVVRSRQEALEIIKFCREKELFDVNIIILDELKEIESIEIEGAVPVVKYIQLDSEYKQLLSLVADVYYVADFNQAQEMSLKYPGQRFLTDANVILRQGEAIIGSDPSHELGYIDREGKIERLEKDLNDAQRKSAELNEEISGLDTKRLELEQTLNSAESKREKLNYELAVLRKSLEVNQENKNRLLQEESVLSSDIDAIKSQLENDAARKERLQSEIEDKDAQLKKSEQELSSLQTELNNIIEHKHDLSVQLAQLEEKQSSLSERKKQFQVLCEAADLELSNLIKDQEKRRQDYNDTVAKISQLKEEIEKLENENRDLRTQIEEGEAALENNKRDYERLKLDFDKEEDALIQLRNEYTTQKDSAHELDLNINEEEYKIKSIRDRITQKYNIAEIPEVKLAPEEEASLRAEIQQLQDKVQKIGAVNLVAIEEHKQLQERLSFLEKQEQDLLEAKDSLTAAIRKINKTTRELFSETFQKVRAAFKDIFPRLFGGGDADLVLEKGVDCLEAGIEILARPPGKKLQSVNLLSGGEKSLTALALLFAIFKIKPSPFCILDEVDAPLDESNIDRFSQLLEEFSRHSQFLVITHNKRTISAAEVIYGITMEKTGISKIVSVKFQNTEEAPVH